MSPAARASSAARCLPPLRRPAKTNTTAGTKVPAMTTAHSFPEVLNAPAAGRPSAKKTDRPTTIPAAPSQSRCEKATLERIAAIAMAKKRPAASTGCTTTMGPW